MVISSIVHRFVKNTFDDMRESTYRCSILTQTITIPESETTIKFEIWIPQDRSYKSLAPMYYRNANAALCVYDTTSVVAHFKSPRLDQRIEKQAPEDALLLL